MTNAPAADKITKVAWKRALLFMRAVHDELADLRSANRRWEIMRIRVGSAVRQTGDAFPFSVSETPEPVLYGTRKLAFCEPVTVTGTFVYDGKAFTVSANASAALQTNCARCEKTFTERIAVSFSERFVKEAGEAADDETYLYTGDELDLGKAVMDNLLLELPIAPVCREDCKGLCPVCGADRNTTKCACIINEG